MFPLKLTFEGLYSYKNKTKIDFTKLTSAGIFGIFGAVGSGKSTILDAITLALFGRVDRLHDREKINLVNLRTNILNIEFEFLAGKDKKKYKFTFTLKVNREESETNKKTYQYIWDETIQDWLPKSLIAEDILGLSYENFNRTIILPQGKFQEFLHLQNSHRGTMLSELFNLQAYNDLYDKLTPIEQDTKNKIAEIEGALQILQESTPEKLNLLKNNIKDLKIQKEDYENQNDLLKKEKQELDILEKNFEQLQKEKAEFEKLATQEEEIKAKKQELLLFSKCKELFSHALEQEIKLEKSIQNYENKQKLWIENQIKLTKELDLAEENFEKAKKELSKKDEIKEKLEDLKNIAKISLLLQELENLEQNIQPTQEKLKNILLILQQKNDEIEQIKKEILDKTQNKPAQSMQILMEVKNWFEKKDQFSAELQKNAEELANSERMIENIAKELNLNLNYNENTLSLIREEIKLKTQEFKTQIEDFTAQKNELQVRKKLQDYSKNLEEGKPCPLCGALHHPDILNSEEVEEALQEVEDKLNNENEKLKNIRDIEKKLDTNSEFLYKNQQEYEKRKKILDDFERTYKWTKDFEKAREIELLTLIDKHNRLDKDIKEKTEKLEILQKDLETHKQQKEVLENTLQQTEKEKNLKNNEKDFLIRNLKHLKNYQKYLKEDFPTRIQAGNTKLNEIETNFEKCNQNLQNIKNQSIELETQINNTANQLKESKTEWTKVHREIEQKIKDNQFKDKNQVQKILMQKIDIQQEQKVIDSFFEKQTLVKGKIDALEAQAQGKIYDKITHNNLITNLKNIQETLKNIDKDLTISEASIQKIEKDLEAKTQFEIELKVLQQKADDIAALKSVFIGKKFINYISRVYLEDLCCVANLYFQTFTRQQLSLELDEQKESFLVCDFLHEGKKRSVKTLSGGQTFQASLSLALALAEIVQSFQYTTEKFFFMDEGFGSLDDDSLATIFETLQSLREEKRVVGIISHVEKLKDEISTFLKVQIDAEGSSSLELVNQ
jgi:exonuclease SbcC